MRKLNLKTASICVSAGLVVALAVNLMVSETENTMVVFTPAHQLQAEPACVPDGSYVLSLADQRINEIIQPECLIR